jgi:cell pole-organizing protein PopZ
MHSAEFRKTVEPDMEDLLTSIRQAINENVGLPPEAAEPKSVEAEELGPSRADEIAALRNKIASQLKEPREPLLKSLPPPPSRFAGLMGGNSEMEESAEEPPPLRSRYLDDEPPPQPMREPEPPVGAFGGRRHEPSFSSSWNAPPRPSFAPRDTYAERTLMSPAASAATNAAFGRLAENMVARAIGDGTIEQMTQDLLRGMLKTWLDDNLPGIVERLVREEIERVARRDPYR